MSKGDFDSILDECLQAMARGDSLESCLARYPKQAQELRGLLSLAQNIRHLPLTEPSGPAQAAAWQRFYRRSSDLRAARRPAFGWLRPVAVVAAVLLALIAAGGGTIYAASRSLPDNPLYPVKLFTEEARLWFVFDDMEEADILLSQAETRINEIKALVQEDKSIPENVLSALRRRTVRAIRIMEDNPGDAQLTERARQLTRRHEDLLLALWQHIEPEARDQYASALATLHNAQLIIQGEGQAVSTFNPQELVAGVFEVSGASQPSPEAADVWNIGGVDVLVDPRTLGYQDIEANRLTKAVVARGADGRLHALKLTVGPQEPAQENVVISGIVEAVSDNEVRIAGQSFALTEETLARLRLQMGRRVEVTVSTPDGRAVAAEVKPLPAGGAEAGEPFAYEGTIEGEASLQQEANRWLIGGQPFIVPQNVAIDALAGLAIPGARIRVEAVRQNGNAVASRLVVLASERPNEQVSLEGVLEDVTPQGQWQVSGFLLEVGRDQSPPPRGTTVKVQGRRQGQAIKAESFLVLQQPDEKDGLTKVSGFILQVKDDRWRVGIVNVTLTDDTEVNGEPIVGARALVWGRPGSRGSLEAVYIDVLDSKPFILSSGPSQQDNSGPSADSDD